MTKEAVQHARLVLLEYQRKGLLHLDTVASVNKTLDQLEEEIENGKP